MAGLSRRLLLLPQLLALLALELRRTLCDPGRGAAGRVGASARGPGEGAPSPPMSAPTPKPAAVQPDAAAVYARIEPDLRLCYDVGHRTTPEMLDGRVTLVAAIEVSGAMGCVIPSDSTGLTQDVEDCMAARLATERFEPGPAWSWRRSACPTRSTRSTRSSPR